MTITSKEYFNLKEAAVWLGVSVSYLRRLVHEGKLPAASLGKLIVLKRQDIEALIEKKP